MPRLLPVLFLFLAFPANAAVSREQLPAQRLVAAAIQVLQRRTEGVPGEWIFRPNATLEDSLIANGEDSTIEADDIHGRWPRKHVGVRVRILHQGRLVQSRLLWFNVERWMTVPVYADDFAAGISLADVRTRAERVDVADIRGYVPSMAEVIPDNAQLISAVRAGMPLRPDDFRPTPAVLRHSRVTVAVRQGDIVLSIPAIAQADASIGQTVKVLVGQTEHWLTTKVVSKNEVILEQ